MLDFIYRLYLEFKFKKKGYPESPFKILKFLNKSQYWPSERLLEYQLKELNKLLFFVKENSSYYSNSLNNISLPLKNLFEFKSKIPLIRKTDIIENIDTIKTKKFTDNFQHGSSGSSGDPLVTYISGLSEVFRKAGHLRFRDWWGIKASDKSVLIWRVKSVNKGGLYLRFKRYLKRRYDLNVFDLNENTILKYYNEIEKFKPAYIRGYATGVLELAELMERSNLRFTKFNLKVAIVTGEVLSLEERNTISKVLNCNVANEYGSADGGLFAYECENGSMHINEESVFIYTNENNIAVVTEIYNESMPLINYSNEDVIIISDDYCSCGRNSRIIDKIIGRESGYIIKPDGTKINQFILMVIFYELYAHKVHNVIRKFRVFQEKDLFRVEIVPLENYNEDCENFLRKRMHEEIGGDIKIEFKLVDKIQREKSGKLRYFIREY